MCKIWQKSQVVPRRNFLSIVKSTFVWNSAPCTGQTRSHPPVSCDCPVAVSCHFYCWCFNALEWHVVFLQLVLDNCVKDRFTLGYGCIHDIRACPLSTESLKSGSEGHQVLHIHYQVHCGCVEVLPMSSLFITQGFLTFCLDPSTQSDCQGCKCLSLDPTLMPYGICHIFRGNHWRIEDPTCISRCKLASTTLVEQCTSPIFKCTRIMESEHVFTTNIEIRYIAKVLLGTLLSQLSIFLLYTVKIQTNVLNTQFFMTKTLTMFGLLWMPLPSLPCATSEGSS